MNRTILTILLTCGAALATSAAEPLRVDAAGAVEIALKNSEQLKMADNAVKQARLNRGVARTAWLPDFSGSATTGWMLPDTKFDEMAMSMRMRGVYMAGISLTQPVFAGGKIVAANRLASIGAEAAAQQRRQTEIAVRADAETGYWTCVAINARREMMGAYMALVDTALAQTRRAVEAGMATRNDLLQIEARRAQVVYQQGQGDAGADLCLQALRNSLGLPLDTPLEIIDTEVPADIPADLENYDLANRPEMKLLQADVDSKIQQVRMTRGDFLPTLGLQAGWSAYGNMKMNSMVQGPDGNYYPMEQNIKNNGFSVMLSLQVPLFHWGEGYKKVKAAKLDVENARLSMQQNARQLDLQVRRAITNVRTGADLLRSAEAACARAEAALTSVSESYRYGLATITALLDAQSQWHTARADLIEARTQLRINLIDYRAATATDF